jgi:DNA-binding NarL/FixJ family response regulator
MTRAFLAVTQSNERSALRLMLLDLNTEVVGEACGWSTTLSGAPSTHLDMLLIDWDLLPANASAALDELRSACPAPVVIVLISHMNSREQAAVSSGADIFISKGDISESVNDRLRAAVKSINERTMK